MLVICLLSKLLGQVCLQSCLPFSFLNWTFTSIVMSVFIYIYSFFLCEMIMTCKKLFFFFFFMGLGLLLVDVKYNQNDIRVMF